MTGANPGSLTPRPDGAPPAGAPAPVETTLELLVRGMRPRQWSKNLILFAALIFSKNLLEVPLLLRSAAGFLVFCLLSGVVYTLNDLIDLEEDRLHESKRHRPLASGALSAHTARVWLVFVTAAALGLAGWSATSSTASAAWSRWSTSTGAR